MLGRFSVRIFGWHSIKITMGVLEMGIMRWVLVASPLFLIFRFFLTSSPGVLPLLGEVLMAHRSFQSLGKPEF